jgi:hypothetical protein
MAESNLFKPQTSTSGIGEKKQRDGQFENPPAYPEVSGFDGSSKIGGKSDMMNLEKTPGARKGRV